MKIAGLMFVLFLALLVTWAVLDWFYLRQAPEARGSNDVPLLALSVYPLIAGVCTWRLLKGQKTVWRITFGLLSGVAFALIGFAAIMTIGLEIHFWIGGSL